MLNYPFPPVPRRDAPRLRAPARCRYDYTGGRPDPDCVRARTWTALAWRFYLGGVPGLAARFSAYAYALGADEMNIGIIVNMVKAAVSGMEPNDIGKMVEGQVRRQGADPRTFWQVVKQVADTRLDAWDRWDAKKAREAREAAAVNVDGAE